MTCVLALDLAKNAGYAVVDDDGHRAVGSWALLDGIKTSGKGATVLDVQHVLQMKRLRSGISMLCRTFAIDVIAIEREFGRGSGTRLLVSLYAAAQEAALDAGLPTLSITLGQWRKHIHGTAGRSTDFYKSEALRICTADSIAVPDADAAEALLIARYVHATARIHPVAAPATVTRKRAA